MVWAGEQRAPEHEIGDAANDCTIIVASLSDTTPASDLAAVLPGHSEALSGTRRRIPAYWRSIGHIGIQVANALQHAHEQGILHRDVKPSNLLLDTRGTVWITDFGLAKTNDQQDLTHSGDVLGTLRYMSPEAFDGKSDARGDVYSLGATLYELAALRPAYDEKDRPQLIKQITTTEPPRLDKLSADVPRDLATVIHKAIDRDPEHRRHPREPPLPMNRDRRHVGKASPSLLMQNEQRLEDMRSGAIGGTPQRRPLGGGRDRGGGGWRGRGRWRETRWSRRAAT
jgi:serine/threonine protein kinase